MIAPIFAENLKKVAFTLGILLFSFQVSLASASETTEEYNATDVIMHHIADAHEWHLATFKEGTPDEWHLTIPLPVILYVPERGGLNIFMSSKFHENGVYDGFMLEHGHIYAVNEAGEKVDDIKVLDFSITKNVASMFLSVVLMLLIFGAAARGYSKRKGGAPKGLQSLLEPLIIFVRDDIAKAMIGEKKHERFMPFLLTVFFFIWINNLLGLLPGAANVTGNLAVTFVLALFALLVINFSGNKYYWEHILWPPGVPVFVKPIMIVIELVGIIAKPFALMVRLFANITAGHIIILSLVSLIFIFGHQYGEGVGVGTSLVAVPFAIFMYCIELLVAFLQAFIFTMLSALFIGTAVEEHH